MILYRKINYVKKKKKAHYTKCKMTNPYEENTQKILQSQLTDSIRIQRNIRQWSRDTRYKNVDTMPLKSCR